MPEPSLVVPNVHSLWRRTEPRWGRVASAASSPRSHAPAVAGAALIEPLTPKEREVLGHLANLLTTAEIAETMYISPNTGKTHVRSILRKLAVERRYKAVRRARELEIVL